MFDIEVIGAATSSYCPAKTCHEIGLSLWSTRAKGETTMAAMAPAPAGVGGLDCCLSFILLSRINSVARAASISHDFR